MAFSTTPRQTRVAVLLILIAIVYRILPHPYNVTPVTAVAIFSAAVLPLRMAFLVPLIAMIVSDLWIGPHDLFWLTWSAFAATGFLGLWVRRRVGFWRVTAASLAGSTFYFGITNLGVFLFQDLYPKTFGGLTECYVMAVPFYRQSLTGDLLFSALLFGIYACAGLLQTRPAAKVRL